MVLLWRHLALLKNPSILLHLCGAKSLNMSIGGASIFKSFNVFNALRKSIVKSGVIF
jgi:hypothetical protein